MKTKDVSLSDQLRQAILDCGKTRYRIALDTGIDPAALSRFINGSRGVSTYALDTLGRYLNLRLVVVAKSKSESNKSRKG